MRLVLFWGRGDVGLGLWGKGLGAGFAWFLGELGMLVLVFWVS